MDHAMIEVFPTRRIKPFDGMAVTAGAWGEAHDYHRRYLAGHHLLWHGAGIVAGLEVVASDPPDSAVSILPGVAVDARGNTILLAGQFSYDLGAASGRLSLWLLYEESPAMPASGEQDGPNYVHPQFGFEARADPPAGPAVEVARIWRQDRNARLANARDPVHPGLNEIDLRFRRHVVTPPPAAARLAVVYLGTGGDRRHGRGLDLVARGLRESGQLEAWVDEGIDLAAGVEGYALLYLVGLGSFQLSRDQMKALYDYLKAGGTVLIESCRQGSAGGSAEPPADSCFREFLSSLGTQLQELPRGHALLREPYLFGAPPAGFETQGRLLAGDAILFSTWDYGCLWQGEHRGGAASRDEIRTALEWGANLVMYAAARRSAGAPGG